MKRLVLMLPIALALSAAAPAFAADETVVDTLLNRIERLTERNAHLTSENERLSRAVADAGTSPIAKALVSAQKLSADDAAAQAGVTGARVVPSPQAPPVTPSAAPLDQGQFDARMRQWVADNAGFIFDSVNKHLAEKQQASQPKTADFAARADDIFRKGALKAGAPDTAAKVRLVVFADYNCRYCKQMDPVVEELMQANPDLQVVYRDLPILAPTSRLAAQAARAADRQGKFLAFHRELYKLPQIDEKAIQDLAATLGLDLERLKQDMTSPEIASQVTNDFNLGQSLRINGTPFLYVEGADRTFPGAVPAADLQQAIAQVRSKG
ncbi:DsbA family protein [Azospirillum canadense]|uniref:DsbA family protein n=1 Tax=Azospirillum canadense TaxID=403962 RepID=UPI002225D2FC|nr:DsbA family protein [Azospirillum canadense]MCW2239263.1 protein-disulfide isomerase [Azospirillum canadense]